MKKTIITILFLLLILGCNDRGVGGIEYAKRDGSPLLLDLYLPVGNGPHPVIIIIHGGGWIFGSRSEGYWLGKALSEEGYAAVSIDYTFSNVSEFPAQIEDCISALRWIEANREKYRFSNATGVIGASAGGHLAALLGATEPEIDAVVDIAGPSDLLSINSDCSNAGLAQCQDLAFLVHELLECNPDECQENAMMASPSRRVSGTSSPMLIIHGDQDQIVPIEQARRLSKALSDFGVESRLVILKGQGHEVNFSIVEMREFLDSHLKP